MDGKWEISKREFLVDFGQQVNCGPRPSEKKNLNFEYLFKRRGEGPSHVPDEKKYKSGRFCVCGLLYGLKPRDHLEPKYISKLKGRIICQD